MTQVIRINITGQDIGKSIKDECDLRFAAGYRLASALLVGNDLILIFQKS